MLPTQQVNINFRGGLDRKTDERLVIPSKLVVADDVEFVDHDTIITRCGTSRIPVSSAYLQPVRMFEHGGDANIEHLDGRVVRANGGNSSEFSSTDYLPLGGNTNAFTRVGVITKRLAGLTRKEPGIGSSLYGIQFDCATGGGTYCAVWERDRTGDICYSIRDLTTDVELKSGVISPAGALVGAKPRVTYDWDTSYYNIFYAQYTPGGTSYSVMCGTVDEGTGPFTPVGTILTTAVGAVVESSATATALFDVSFMAGRYVVAARSTVAAGSIHMVLLDGAFTAITPVRVGVPATVPVSLTTHITEAAGVVTGHALYGSGLNLRGYYLPSNTTTLSAENTIATYATKRVGRIAVTDFTGGDLLVTFDGFTSTANLYGDINVLRINTAHALVSSVNATTITGFIAGRSFQMRGKNFLPVIFTSAQYQSVILVFDLTVASTGLGTLDFPTSIVARLDWGEVAPPSPLALDAGHRVPACFDQVMLYTKFETNTRLAGTVNVTEVCLASARFSPQEQLGDAKWNGDTYLAGACPQVCDGANIVEEGFHWNPEIVGTVTKNLVTVAPIATGTGKYTFPNTAPATYTIAFTESWEDAQGNWHESGIAFLGQVSIAALANRDINPTILRPPSLKPNRKLLMYRSLGTGTDTTLYLAHTDEYGVGAPIDDANLPNGEPLYIEGGILPNTPAPACRQIATFAGRLVLSGCDDGSRIFISKKGDKGFAAEFVSDDNAFSRIIPPESGRVVGCAEMSGKLVVVAEQRIGIVYGSGPNDTNTVGEFTEFEPVAVDIGAKWTAPKSIKLSAEGIWFQSPYGLRLFGSQGIARDNKGLPIGSAVDDLVSGNVVTISGGNTQQTRFTMPYFFLVWDQLWGQFTRFSDHDSVDACTVKGDYYFVSESEYPTLLRRRDPSWGASDSTISGGVPSVSYFSGVVALGDIQFGGVQGFQRVRNMVLLGRAPQRVTYTSPKISIYVSYDNDRSFVTPEVADIVPTMMPDGTFQLEHQFFRQKCETMQIQIRFRDEPTGPAFASPIRLTDLALSVGVKRGPWKSAEVK